MSYLQTNIGDLKNELKKLQETTNAQIERLQNLLEKKIILIMKNYHIKNN